MKLIFDKYIVKFPDSIKYELFNDVGCSGIYFYTELGKYQLVHNKVDWNRIVINYKNGAWEDLPFNKNTWGFMPDGVVIEEICQI